LYMSILLPNLMNQWETLYVVHVHVPCRKIVNIPNGFVGAGVAGLWVVEPSAVWPRASKSNVETKPIIALTSWAMSVCLQSLRDKDRCGKNCGCGCG
jgi:hypothetical protein